MHIFYTYFWEFHAQTWKLLAWSTDNCSELKCTLSQSPTHGSASSTKEVLKTNGIVTFLKVKPTFSMQVASTIL